MQFGNRASLEAAPRKTIDVPFPDDDTFYRLRVMMGDERDRFELIIFRPVNANGSGKPAVREIDSLYLKAKLVVRCLINEQGNREYADEEFRTLAESVTADRLEVLFAAAQKLNGMDGKAVENAVKNSEGDPDDSLPSGSPDTSEKPSLNS